MSENGELIALRSIAEGHSQTPSGPYSVQSPMNSQHNEVREQTANHPVVSISSSYAAHSTHVHN